MGKEIEGHVFPILCPLSLSLAGEAGGGVFIHTPWKPTLKFLSTALPPHWTCDMKANERPGSPSGSRYPQAT